jgi:cell wall-associated NlpC family hydrolase
MSQPELAERAAQLLARLLGYAELRARFRRDPAGVCAEFGLVEVARELREGGNVLETLEMRESRSNLAGAFMAAASEAIGALSSVDHLHDHQVAAGGADAPGDVGKLGAVAEQAHDFDFGAVRQLAEVHYGFVRASNSGVDYGKLLSAGYNGVLFHPDDPDLAQAISTARAAGIPDVGIWAPAHGQDPEAFALGLAALTDKYHPSIVVPDVEFEGKGPPGSPQWEWSEKFAKLYHKLEPDQTWAVTVMPFQEPCNYGAFTHRGAGVWPQTYGETYDTTFDPQAVIQRLIVNGVDPDVINPVLAPNQSGAGLSHYASYALDDFGGNYPAYVRSEHVPELPTTGSPATGPPAAPDPAADTPPSADPVADTPPSADPAADTPPSADPAALLGRPAPAATGPSPGSGFFDILAPAEPKGDVPAGRTLHSLSAVEARAGHQASQIPTHEVASEAAHVLPDPADAYPGDGASREAIAHWMARQAHKAGLPGELPVMAAWVESGLRNLHYGDRDSIGFFQTRTSLWGHLNAELQLKWFIDHALAVRRQHVTAGDRTFGEDDRSWGSWVADVERPSYEYRDRYQQVLDEVRQLLRSSASARPHGATRAALEHGVDLAGAGPAAGRATAALAIAERYLGTPYLWGGDKPPRFDCSGLVQYAYGQVGVHLPRVAADQFRVGIHLTRDQLRPGAGVFFADSHGYIHHEGIYIGSGKFLHAPHTGDDVKISSLDEPYYAKQFAGGRWFTGLADHNVPVRQAVAAHGESPDESDVVNALLSDQGRTSPTPPSTVQFLPAVSDPEGDAPPPDASR